MENNIIPHEFTLTRQDKETLLKQNSVCIWLMGLSASGKSTIANEMDKQLYKRGKLTKLLDGDDVRNGICSNLSFSQNDRSENLRRVSEVAKLFVDTGVITICCFITPLNSQREMIKKNLRDDIKFIYVNTSVEDCEKRDPKGLYKKARKGEILNFTGISSEFEAPAQPVITVDSSNESPEQIAIRLIEQLNL